jgi:MoaA/NifB/PqqE/SkfB family radical SAM enzyme
MDFDLFRRLIDQGAQYGLASIKLNYLGEPLLHPDLLKQLRYAKAAGMVDTMFNTNATQLTEEKAHEVLEAGIDNIFFSVDSAYREKYNAIRIGSDFDKVVANIVRFCEIKRKGDYARVQTRVSLTVMENDLSELVAFKDFWLEHVDVVGFGLYHDLDGIESPYNPNFTCAQPFQRMFVMWDGVTTPCCVDYERGYVTGNARTTSLKEVWDGPAYQKMRAAQTTGRYKDIGVCAKCYVPYTSLDGQVIAFEDVGREAKAAAEEQRMRSYADPNQELPARAIRRKAKGRI